MAKTKTTPRKPEEMMWKCGFCPTSFKTKSERDEHITECANSRIFCSEKGCYYNTDKQKNLERHVKSQHSQEEALSDDESVKSSRLSSPIGRISSDDEWEDQDPGDVLIDSSMDKKDESVPGDEDNQGIDKDEKMIETNVRQVLCEKSSDIIALGRTFRQKTAPRLPGVRKSVKERLGPVASPEETTGSSTGTLKRECTMTESCPTCKKRASIETVSTEVQTDPLLYTRKVMTETKYREGNKRITTVEWKETV